MRVRIAILAKAPVPGQVKTRLGRKVGDRAAAGLYTRMLRDVAAMVQGAAGGPVTLWHTPVRHPLLTGLARHHGFDLASQPRGPLGARLRAIARESLRDSEAVLMVGGDCIGLGPAHIRAARRCLAEGLEAVFAPAPDGGYTLVGLTRRVPRLFQGIDWGTPAVMGQTLAAGRRGKVRLGLIAPANDLDDWADLRRWRREAGSEVIWRRQPRGGYDAAARATLGAGGGNRTRTLLREPDFESGASTSSATPARSAEYNRPE